MRNRTVASVADAQVKRRSLELVLMKMVARRGYQTPRISEAKGSKGRKEASQTNGRTEAPLS